MIGKITLLAALVALWPASSVTAGDSVGRITGRLHDAGIYRATVNYSVTLPQAIDDVVYTVDLTARGTENKDPLSPADYLIEWSVPVENGTSSGFSAYFNGNHYRYSDERLIEYHTATDSLPFITRHQGTTAIPGVQRSARFASLLPQFIADELDAAATDPDYRISVEESPSAVTVKTERIVGGYTCSELTYTFSADTGLPIALDADYNPGAIGEQIISARYDYSGPLRECPPEMTEEWLIGLYPQEFGLYRESTFAIDNMPGKHLPGFSLPTPDGRRLTRRADTEFPAPTVVALIDQDNPLSQRLITDVRSAMDQFTADVMVIWAFTGNRADDIEPLLDRSRPEESVVMSARSLARDCGAPMLPVLLVCRPDGIVHKIIVGYNNSLTTDIIGSLATI